MATALLIDDDARERIKRLVAFASKPENHYRPNHSGARTPGNNPKFVEWFGTYRCVFTFTIMPDGCYRHLSVSVKKKGRWPLPEGVEMLGTLFGFQGSFAEWPKGTNPQDQAVIIAQKTDVPSA